MKNVIGKRTCCACGRSEVVHGEMWERDGAVEKQFADRGWYRLRQVDACVCPPCRKEIVEAATKAAPTVASLGAAS